MRRIVGGANEFCSQWSNTLRSLPRLGCAQGRLYVALLEARVARHRGIKPLLRQTRSNSPEHGPGVCRLGVPIESTRVRAFRLPI